MSRIDDVLKNYPSLDKDTVTKIMGGKNNKYLLWGVKQLACGGKLDDVNTAINEFEKKAAKLSSKDIYTFSLEALLKELDTAKSKKDVKRDGSEKIYEDDDWTVLYITTPEASTAYGKGTRWCISAKVNNAFMQHILPEFNVKYYDNNSVNFYFVINKKDKNKKYAFYMRMYNNHANHDVKVYNCQDQIVQLETLSISNIDMLNIYSKIINHFKNNKDNMINIFKNSDDKLSLINKYNKFFYFLSDNEKLDYYTKLDKKIKRNMSYDISRLELKLVAKFIEQEKDLIVLQDILSRIYYERKTTILKYIKDAINHKKLPIRIWAIQDCTNKKKLNEIIKTDKSKKVVVAAKARLNYLKTYGC